MSATEERRLRRPLGLDHPPRITPEKLPDLVKRSLPLGKRVKNYIQRIRQKPVGLDDRTNLREKRLIDRIPRPDKAKTTYIAGEETLLTIIRDTPVYYRTEISLEDEKRRRLLDDITDAAGVAAPFGHDKQAIRLLEYADSLAKLDHVTERYAYQDRRPTWHSKSPFLKNGFEAMLHER